MEMENLPFLDALRLLAKRAEHEIRGTWTRNSRRSDAC